MHRNTKDEKDSDPVIGFYSECLMYERDIHVLCNEAFQCDRFTASGHVDDVGRELLFMSVIRGT